MNYSKVKNPVFAAVLAAIGFTACKKNDVTQPEPVLTTIDSSTVEAFRVTNPKTVATYYISPSGNDATGTGTATSPWKTLYKATSTVSTNNAVIHVNAGTYTETMTCNLNPGVSIEGDGVSSVL